MKQGPSLYEPQDIYMIKTLYGRMPSRRRNEDEINFSSDQIMRIMKKR